MMRIRINYFGHFRTAFHKRSEEVQMPKNTNLYDLLSFLSERNGEQFKSYVFDAVNTGIKDDVLLNINGIPSNLLNGLKTQLSNGDQVNIMPLFSGGG